MLRALYSCLQAWNSELRKDERGQTTSEYLVIVGLIIGLVVAVIGWFSPVVQLTVAKVGKAFYDAW